MVIEYDGLMPQFANQQIFFFDLPFEGQRSFKLLLCRFECRRCFRSPGFDILELFLEIFDLRLRVLYKLT